MFSFGHRDSPPLGLAARVLLVLIGALFVGGFTLACFLEPSARLLGTHEQLGLPPCTFRVVLGVPCPTCGMTTSFAYLVRGQLLSALRANFAGVCLAIVCVLLIPWCWWSAYRGRFWRVSEPVTAFAVLVVGLVLVSLVNWGWQLLPVLAV